MAVLWVICVLLAVVLFLVARRLYQARARVERLESRLASVLVRGETGLSVLEFRRSAGCLQREVS